MTILISQVKKTHTVVTNILCSRMKRIRLSVTLENEDLSGDFSNLIEIIGDLGK